MFLVGLLSGSSTSVSGPSPGLIGILIVSLAVLPSFEAILLAIVIAGLIQIGLGLARFGYLSAFIPTGVVKGLIAALGIILILKQIPHIFGHDTDPEGEMSFWQSPASRSTRPDSRFIDRPISIGGGAELYRLANTGRIGV